jgi:hypothetical protein
MKSTICTDSGARVIVSPDTNGEKLTMGINLNVNGMSVRMTPDQVGALIFGFESALSVMEMRRAVAA